MTKTSELTMAERSELIKAMSNHYYDALKSVIPTGDGEIDSQAFSNALARLDASGIQIDVIPYLAQVSSDYFEHLDPMAVNGFHGRVEIQSWEMISKACDLFRVLHGFRL